MFVLRMAVRETRASLRRLFFFFVCIAVGVAAIVALRSVIQSVRGVFGSEAKSLIAADVLIATNRDWTADARATIDRRLGDAGITDRTETVETPTMVRPADRSKVVAKMTELRAVQPRFPLYGSVELQGSQTYSPALLADHGVLVRPELLTAIDVAVGDQIVIGQASFTIRGVIVREPGRGMGEFSLGPRVIIAYDDLASTGLLGFGSRARRAMLVKMPEERVEPLVKTLREDFKDDFINTRSFRSTEDQVGRDFDRAENYLSLVGLIIVILGGIAVSSVTRVFILQKIRSIAVLKCLGARSGQIISVYILQVMTLGLAGSLLGIVMARGVLASIPLMLGASTSILAQAHYGVSWSAAVQGMAIGVLVSLLFSVVPLLHVRFIKPSLLLRDESVRRARDWAGMAVIAVVSLALVALTAWQAASLKVGIVVCLGFAGLAVVLHLAGRALIALIAPMANSRSFPLRHAVLHLSRPGNQTRVILLAVGLGAFFIVGVRSLQASLLERVLAAGGRQCAGHVSARHPERAGRRSESVPGRPRARRRGVPADSGSARQGGRRRWSRDEPGRCRRSAPAGGLDWARVHDHLSRSSGVERAGDSGRVLERTVGGCRSVGGEIDCGAGAAARGRYDALRRARPDRGRPRHQHSRRGMARVEKRRVRVRVSARACSIRRRRPSSRRSRGRRASTHGRASSTISSSVFRTSRSSISMKCSRPFATSCPR